MIPLADRLRPQVLEEYIGQKHILSEEKLLYKVIKSGQLFSMIFWGPPGVGKTTLARLIAKETEADFLEFSAVTTSIADLKKIFTRLSAQPALQKTIVFIDEIHRFNKAQQDAFLPFVENGTIILIGATTENPSFEIISALLSRMKVFVLNPLSPHELKAVVNRALSDKNRGFGKQKIHIEEEALDFLLEGVHGDARILLNSLESALGGLNSESKVSSKKIVLTKGDIEESLQKRALSYDKGGEEHYNTISAFIKSMRASDIDASLYYLARMVEAGEDPLFIARRMVIFAAEDIGLAQPTAIVVANEVFKSCEVIGYPECQINLAFGTAYLAQAKKDRGAYEAYFNALEDVQKFGNLEIPFKIRNAPTALMKNLGYGQGYQKYPQHDSYLPLKIRGKVYYQQKKKED